MGFYVRGLKCQGKEEQGIWFNALDKLCFGQTNSIKEHGVLSHLCLLEERNIEKRPPKERHSCLPVSLHHFLFVYLKISKSFSLQTEQSFIPLSSIFPSRFSNNRLPYPFFSSFPLPLLAASTCTSLPYTPQALLSSSSFTYLLVLIASSIPLSPDEFQTSKQLFTLRYKQQDLFLHRWPTPMPQKCTTPIWTAHQATGVLTACPKTNTHTVNYDLTQTNTQSESPSKTHDKLLI